MQPFPPFGKRTIGPFVAPRPRVAQCRPGPTHRLNVRMAIRTKTSTNGRSRSAPLRPTLPEPLRRGGLSAPLRLLRFTVLATIVAAGVSVSLVLALIGYLGFRAARVEIPREPSLPETTFLFSRTGERIAQLPGPEHRIVVELDELPGHLVEAVVAAEDEGFFDHGGIDARAIVRAALTDLGRGELVEGGSTITQQYVKNVFTGAERTFARKLEEAALAIELERRWTKEEILEAYLNTIAFGRRAYGVEAASRMYFGVPASRLGVRQSALLAGLIAGPTRYDPVRRPTRAERRRNYVLARMSDAGALSSERAQRLSARPLGVDLHPVEFSEAPYFTDVVERFLSDRYGSGRASSGGLRVKTTLDMRWQRAAERAVRNALGEPGDPSAALVAIDPRSGEIRALVGGRNWNRLEFNLATQAERQTGSAFKPFVLAAALEAGISPLSLMTGPSQLTIDDPRCSTNGEPWEVGNYSDAGFGTMSVADGLARSVNTMYAQLALEVGPERVAAVAERMGIEGPLAPVCSIALGVEEVTPLEMTSAFATIAAGGIHREPTPVRAVREDGERLERPIDRRGTEAISPRDAAVLTWAMRGVVERGTGTAAALPGRPVAGKTGTSQEYANAWFCGFVPQLAACVWVGHPEGNVPMAGVAGLSGVTGGSIPAGIWQEFMLAATARMKVLEFPEPDLSGYRFLPPPPMPDPPDDEEKRDDDDDGDSDDEGDGDGDDEGNGDGDGNGGGDRDDDGR